MSTVPDLTRKHRREASVRRGDGRSHIVLMILIAVVALLSACSGGSSATGSTAGTGAATYGELSQAFLAYAQCARTHGLPDLPDPVVDQQGNDTYPPLTGTPQWPQSVLTGCASTWDHVHEVRARYDASTGLSSRPKYSMSPAEQLAFSQCIRRHGFPSYPDPGPGGTVANVPPGFQKPHLSDAAIAAIQTCSRSASHG